MVLDDPNTLVPLLYTPGVGTACWDYGRIPKTPPYLTLSIEVGRTCLCGWWCEMCVRYVCVCAPLHGL